MAIRKHSLERRTAWADVAMMTVADQLKPSLDQIEQPAPDRLPVKLCLVWPYTHATASVTYRRAIAQLASQAAAK